MSDKSKIEWTDATWGPVTGCSKVSQGCKNCYAEREWPRLSAPRKKPNIYTGREFTDVQCHPKRLDQPLRWKKPRRIFVNSMSDLFHEDVPFEFIDQIFAVMACAYWHTFQILTKRPKIMLDYLSNYAAGGRHIWTAGQSIKMPRNLHKSDTIWPLPNVWLGVSVEDQETADERIPLLLEISASVRWLSAEPLLRQIEFRPYTLTERPCFVCKIEDDLNEPRGTQSHPINCGWRHDNDKSGSGIDWVVVGGESGPNARPMHPAWARSLRDQCQAAQVPFLFKQWGEHRYIEAGVLPEFQPNEPNKDQGLEYTPAEIVPGRFCRCGKKIAGRTLDGKIWDEYPI